MFMCVACVGTSLAASIDVAEAASFQLSVYGHSRRRRNVFFPVRIFGAGQYRLGARRRRGSADVDACTTCRRPCVSFGPPPPPPL